MLVGLVRRARHKPQRPPKNLGEKVAQMTRGVVLKPLLLVLLPDIQKVVNDAFERAEKRVKKL
jgi:hypothetical protein